MAADKFKRIKRTTHLTQEEVQRDRKVRAAVMAEFPPKRNSEAAPDSLSAELREAIRASPRTVYDLCKTAHISPIVVSRFLSGERDIRLATAEKLASVLGLKLAAKG